MFVCMHVCMYVYHYVCILFYISNSATGSLVSVGVGPWYCMLKCPGSNPLCVLRRFGQVLFSWGGGGVIERKFPTTFYYMGNFPQIVHFTGIFPSVHVKILAEI